MCPRSFNRAVHQSEEPCHACPKWPRLSFYPVLRASSIFFLKGSQIIMVHLKIQLLRARRDSIEWWMQYSLGLSMMAGKVARTLGTQLMTTTSLSMRMTKSQARLKLVHLPKWLSPCLEIASRVSRNLLHRYLPTNPFFWVKQSKIVQST